MRSFEGLYTSVSPPGVFFLDLLEDMDTDAFLMSLRHFIS